MRLILVRHGETVENAQGIIQGHLPGKLSEKGRVQAEKIAEKLNEERLDTIYSSDLARASDTAMRIAEQHPGTPLHLTEDLRERNLGEMQGKRKDEIDFRMVEGNPVYPPLKEGESLQELYERAKNFLEKIMEKHAGKDSTILLVSHSDTLKAVSCAIEGKGPEGIIHHEDFPNTGVREFKV
ncbi:MAG: histidine phosphatase family protein [Candidatus Woesearchaeota archaeon]